MVENWVHRYEAVAILYGVQWGGIQWNEDTGVQEAGGVVI